LFSPSFCEVVGTDPKQSLLVGTDPGETLATLPDGTREATPQGVPQGGPLSPLLANIALDPLDKELESRGHKFARYADDFIVLVKSANAAKRVLAALTRYCEGPLKLTVNRAKSRAAETMCLSGLPDRQQRDTRVDGQSAAPLQGAGS
jgi:hypothetical protein